MQSSSEEGQNWWKSVDSSTVDPITLEPVRDFSIEPFQLDKTLFDGEMLAHYLISTALFENPATRAKITREDCLRLDEHLSINKVKTNKTKVVEAYDLLQNVSVQSKREQSETMRREATLLFQHLFTFRSRRNELRHRNNSQQRSRRQQQNRTSNQRPLARARSSNTVGLQIIDDDDESNFYPEGQFSYFDLDRDFPELFPVGNVHLNNNQMEDYANNGPVLPNKRSPNESNTRLITPKPRGGSQVGNDRLSRSNSNQLRQSQKENDGSEESDSDQRNSSNESEQFHKLFANFQKATSSDRSQNQATSVEDDEEEEEGDIPLFDEKLGLKTSSRSNQLEVSTEQAPLSKQEEMEDSEKQRMAAENEIRAAMQRSNRNPSKKKQYSKPPSALPPKTSILNVTPSVPDSIHRSSIDQPQPSETDVVPVENIVKQSRRVFANPISRKGPCLASIVATILLAGAFFCALLVFSDKKIDHLFE